MSKRFTLFIVFISVGIVFLGGCYIGYKSVSKKQQIFSVLVQNPLSRYLILQYTSRATSEFNKDFKAVDCPADHLAIASFGQSNTANNVVRNGGMKAAFDDGKTFMWSWVTGKCYPYSEPLVGTNGEDGNILTDTVRQVRKDNYDGNLILIGFGKGGSSVFDWSHVWLSVRLDNVLLKLKESKINPLVFFWHQGEVDAVPEVYAPWKTNAYGNLRGSVTHFYSAALSIIVEKIRKYFPTSAIGVALASVCGNEGNDLIIKGQKRVADKYDNVRISSNTDRLGSEFRDGKGCHFNELGAARIGEDYGGVIKKEYLAKSPK